MKINIIGTGSTGNCIVFNDTLMIDAGLSFKKISGHISLVSMVLLTHEHGDHYNATTIRKIFTNNESVKFCCNERLSKMLMAIGIPSENIVQVEAGKVYKKDDIMFSPVNLYHDVPNFGYRLIKGDYKHFHATDTFTLDGIEAINYDSATIEANHCLESALAIIEDAGLEFTHMKRTIKTHLNVDKAIEFISRNDIKSFIPIHVGAATRENVFAKIKEANL